MKRLFLLSFALTFASMAYASTATIVKGDVQDGFQNVLSNSSFDFPTQDLGWTKGTGVSDTRDTTNYFDGKASVYLTGTSVTHELFYQDVTPGQQFNTVNMEAGAWVKTSLTGIQVCPRLAGTTLTSQCVNVPATSTWQPVSANMIGPASGSVGIAVYSTGTITPTANQLQVDAAYVGRARNLSQVSQAQFLGTINWAATASCFWVGPASTSFATPAAVSACPTPTVTGSLQAPATKIPAMTFASMPPGDYYFVGHGSFACSGNTVTSCAFQFSDGTNSSATVALGNGGTASIAPWYVPNIAGHIKETTSQSNVTVSIQMADSASAADTIIYANHTPPAVGLEVDVYYFPSQSQLALRPDATPASWSGTTTLAGSTTSGSTTDFGSVTGAVTQTASRNMTCSAAASLVGLTCTLPRLGNYLVCYSGSAGNTVDGSYVQSALYDGSNVEITGIQTATSPSASGNVPIGACATYTATASSPTFKLRGLVGANTGNIFLNSFSIVELDAPMPAPYLTGSVTSKGASNYFWEYATLNLSGASAVSINSQSGTWISSATAASTVFTVNYSGEWSGPPACTFVCHNNTSNVYPETTTAPTSSSFSGACINSSGAATTSDAISITCGGPR